METRRTSADFHNEALRLFDEAVNPRAEPRAKEPRTVQLTEQEARDESVIAALPPDTQVEIVPTFREKEPLVARKDIAVDTRRAAPAVAAFNPILGALLGRFGPQEISTPLGGTLPRAAGIGLSVGQDPLDIFSQTVGETGIGNLIPVVPQLTRQAGLGGLFQAPQVPTLFTEGPTPALEKFRIRPIQEQIALSFADPFAVGGAVRGGVRAVGAGARALPRVAETARQAPGARLAFSQVAEARGLEARLPRALAGASPRFKTKKLQFASDIDKALFIIANPTTRSKRHADFVAFVTDNLGISAAEAERLGREVRATIGGLATGRGDTITLSHPLHVALSGRSPAELAALRPGARSVTPGARPVSSAQVGGAGRQNIDELIDLGGGVSVPSPTGGRALTESEARRRIEDIRASVRQGDPSSRERALRDPGNEIQFERDLRNARNRVAQVQGTVLDDFTLRELEVGLNLELPANKTAAMRVLVQESERQVRRIASRTSRANQLEEAIDLARADAIERGLAAQAAVVPAAPTGAPAAALPVEGVAERGTRLADIQRRVAALQAEGPEALTQQHRRLIEERELTRRQEDVTLDMFREISEQTPVGAVEDSPLRVFLSAAARRQEEITDELVQIRNAGGPALPEDVAVPQPGLGRVDPQAPALTEPGPQLTSEPRPQQPSLFPPGETAELIDASRFAVREPFGETQALRPPSAAPGPLPSASEVVSPLPLTPQEQARFDLLSKAGRKPPPDPRFDKPISAGAGRGLTPEERAAIQAGQRFPRQNVTPLGTKKLVEGESTFDLELAGAAGGQPPSRSSVSGITGDIPPDDVIQQMSFVPENTRERMIRWARVGKLNAVDFAGILKANMATLDLSYLRQQALLIPRRPVAFGQSFPDAVKAFWSQGYAEKLDAAIRADPDIVLYDKLGGDFLRPLDSKSVPQWQSEESFMVLSGERPLQRLANWLPWIRFSNRGFISGANSMNWKVFKGHLRTLRRQQVAADEGRISFKEFEGFDFEGDVKRFMNYLEDATGRARIGKLNAVSPDISQLFFSLRLMMGRLIVPRHLFSKSKFTRQAAWADFLTAVGSMSAALFIGEHYGLWELETNRRSSDYMKPRLGPIRFDPWGGFQQFAVLYGRLLNVASGPEIKTTKKGEIFNVTPERLLADFLSNKEAPAIGNVMRAWTGEDFKGDEIDRKDWMAWLEKNSPLAAQDVIEAFEAEGLLGLSTSLPAAVVGIGVSTHEEELNDVAHDLFEGTDYDALPFAQRREVVVEWETRNPERAAEDKADKEQDTLDSQEREAKRQQEFRKPPPATPVSPVGGQSLEETRKLLGLDP